MPNPIPATSALSPENWPFSPECLPQPAYLVGGAVRDALLRRQSQYLDLDFVLPANAVQTARQIANRYRAGFVLLDAGRQIARVVFENATADFAQQEGPTLETDLHRRDFTVNAIACNPHTGELIDPLLGCADLQAGLIRMISPANLQDDPLRLLRAYRQASQLGFTIEPATAAAIRHLAPSLAQIAAERVRTELSYLLATPRGTPQLQAALEDNLLQTWFPSATLRNLPLLAEIDRSAVQLRETWPELGAQLCREIRDTLKTSLLAIAKLASFLDPDPQQAEEQLLNLKYSNSEIKAALAVVKQLPQLQATPESMPVREQYFLFRNLGPVFPALAVTAVAAGTPAGAIAPLIQRYLTPEDPVAHPAPLLTGSDLMAALNLPPGPQVGFLLTEIAIARAENRIFTPEAALKFAFQQLRRESGAEGGGKTS
ncbi:CCA tRNA nucleotidyltransferase [Kamptonema formosum]|uniref:CCA tRNA nucleotidyltransferase n=1 Tax=Kamptonema formosum TaxID=331992 RepID=UPI00034C43C9|nr:CCA tRNA nucleotidyltransferase [Oscillatoria sp. PCC 10802]